MSRTVLRLHANLYCFSLQVVRLTEEPYQSATKGVKSPIAAERVADWLVSNKVLSIALGGTDRQKDNRGCEIMNLCVNILIPKLHGNETGSIGVPHPPHTFIQRIEY